ncbi:unnamed protein product [Thlaspi arvense]|uniref:NYN domain-containing protein n=1 Tax=Thlaspi arvense TaxID=13288 RepID=A0AAU9RI84_THLAR|nr:unnamed protein product [Thlaspi arvense]
MMQNKENGVAKTVWVWWNMDLCPVPRGYDAYHVRSSIESALVKNKYLDPAGRVDITAFGNLKGVPNRVLQPLSLSGISLRHAHLGVLDFLMDLWKWEDDNPPPASLMVISGRESMLHEDLSRQKALGYTIFRAIPQRMGFSPQYASQVWLWKSLLTGETGDKRRLEHRETGEPALFCMLCSFAAQTFEGFTMHLKGRVHAVSESHTVPGNLDPEYADEQIGWRPGRPSRDAMALAAEEEEAFLLSLPKDEDAAGQSGWRPRASGDATTMAADEGEASLHSHPKDATTMASTSGLNKKPWEKQTGVETTSLAPQDHCPQQQETRAVGEANSIGGLRT